LDVSITRHLPPKGRLLLTNDFIQSIPLLPTHHRHHNVWILRTVNLIQIFLLHLLLVDGLLHFLTAAQLIHNLLQRLDMLLFLLDNDLRLVKLVPHSVVLVEQLLSFRSQGPQLLLHLIVALHITIIFDYSA
jgi:hypothetical protein